MERSSGARKNSEDYRLIKILAAGFFLVALLNTLSNLFLSDLNLFKVVRLKRASDKLSELIEREKGENLKLKALYSRIKKNPKYYKEKFIREYLLRFKEGEKVVPLPKELWYK